MTTASSHQVISSPASCSWTKGTRKNRRWAQRGSPVSFPASWTGICTLRHILSYIHLNKNIWTNDDVSNGIKVILLQDVHKTQWLMMNNNWIKFKVSSQEEGKNKIYVAMLDKNTLLFLQVHNRKQFSTSSSCRSFLFPWTLHAGCSGYPPSMNKAVSHPEQPHSKRSNNPARWQSLHSMLQRSQELA